MTDVNRRLRSGPAPIRGLFRAMGMFQHYSDERRRRPATMPMMPMMPDVKSAMPSAPAKRRGNDIVGE